MTVQNHRKAFRCLKRPFIGVTVLLAAPIVFFECGYRTMLVGARECTKPPTEIVVPDEAIALVWAEVEGSKTAEVEPATSLNVVRYAWRLLTKPPSETGSPYRGAGLAWLVGTSCMNGQLAIRGIRRNLTVAAVGVWLSRNLNAKQLVASHLQEMYFGNGQRGVVAAAQFYFAATPSELSLGQAAMLIVTARHPTRANPKNHCIRIAREGASLVEKAQGYGLVGRDDLESAMRELNQLILACPDE